MFWEESLSFGSGIKANTKVLFGELPDASMISIVKDCSNITLYDKVTLLDSGRILESGKPFTHLQDKTTVIYNYIKETDPDSHKLLRK